VIDRTDLRHKLTDVINFSAVKVFIINHIDVIYGANSIWIDLRSVRVPSHFVGGFIPTSPMLIRVEKLGIRHVG